MKKIISLLIPLCVAFAMVTAVSFADTNDTEQAPGEDVAVQMQEDQTIDAAKGVEQESADPELTEQKAQTLEGWVSDASGWKYYSGGTYFTGKQKVGSYWYYFKPTDGYMLTGWQRMPDNNMNYYDPTPGEPGKSTFGTMCKGWLKLGPDKYFLDTSNGNMFTEKRKIGNDHYYFDKNNGKMKTGWVTINPDRYYFNSPSGKMRTGWLTYNGHKYYFANNGAMKKGWLKLNNSKYYMNPDNGRMCTGKVSINGSYYYFANNGKMKTGWVKDGSSRYYYASNGKMKTGWLSLNGNKYYLSTKTGKMLTGRKKIGNGHYYFNTSNGKMVKSKAIKYKGKLHYFFASGKEVSGTGWFKGSDGKSRYAVGGGVIATGKKTINGITYVFSSKNGTISKILGDKYDQKIRNMSSDTTKLIYVIKSKHQVRVYSGSRGNWSKIYTFTCSLGDSSSPTSSGTYTVRGKTDHFNYHRDRKPIHWNNGLNLTGSGPRGNGFNGFVWSGEYPDGDIIDSRLGSNCTGGRVRISESNSLWLYNNIHVGTKVLIQ